MKSDALPFPVQEKKSLSPIHLSSLPGKFHIDYMSKPFKLVFQFFSKPHSGILIRISNLFFLYIVLLVVIRNDPPRTRNCVDFHCTPPYCTEYVHTLPFPCAIFFSRSFPWWRSAVSVQVDKGKEGGGLRVSQFTSVDPSVQEGCLRIWEGILLVSLDLTAFRPISLRPSGLFCLIPTPPLSFRLSFLSTTRLPPLFLSCLFTATILQRVRLTQQPQWESEKRITGWIMLTH
jgi:hypothetical protein